MKKNGDEPRNVVEREQYWDPLLDMRQRPVLSSVSSFTQLPPFGAPERRGGQALFESTHDPVFRAVQKPVAADEVEPGETLAEYGHERNGQPRRCTAGGKVLQSRDEPDERGIQRQEKGVFVSPRRALIRSAIST